LNAKKDDDENHSSFADVELYYDQVNLVNKIKGESNQINDYDKRSSSNIDISNNK